MYDFYFKGCLLNKMFLQIAHTALVMGCDIDMDECNIGMVDTALFYYLLSPNNGCLGQSKPRGKGRCKPPN